MQLPAAWASAAWASAAQCVTAVIQQFLVPGISLNYLVISINIHSAATSSGEPRRHWEASSSATEVNALVHWGTFSHTTVALNSMCTWSTAHWGYTFSYVLERVLQVLINTAFYLYEKYNMNMLFIYVHLCIISIMVHPRHFLQQWEFILIISGRNTNLCISQSRKENSKLFCRMSESTHNLANPRLSSKSLRPCKDSDLYCSSQLRFTLSPSSSFAVNSTNTATSTGHGQQSRRCLPYFPV